MGLPSERPVAVLRQLYERPRRGFGSTLRCRGRFLKGPGIRSRLKGSRDICRAGICASLAVNAVLGGRVPAVNSSPSLATRFDARPVSCRHDLRRWPTGSAIQTMDGCASSDRGCPRCLRHGVTVPTLSLRYLRVPTIPWSNSGHPHFWTLRSVAIGLSKQDRRQQTPADRRQAFLWPDRSWSRRCHITLTLGDDPVSEVAFHKGI